VTYLGHGLNSSSVELVHKFVVQPKFVELETELVLAVERVLLIPSLNRDGAVGPELHSQPLLDNFTAHAQKRPSVNLRL